MKNLIYSLALAALVASTPCRADGPFPYTPPVNRPEILDTTEALLTRCVVLDQAADRYDRMASASDIYAGIFAPYPWIVEVFNRIALNDRQAAKDCRAMRDKLMKFIADNNLIGSPRGPGTPNPI